MSQRGRRKGSSGEQSKSALLSIAAEEFSKNGFYKTKVSHIVKRAGVTQPTFYLYFKSKEAVFEELEELFDNRLKELAKKSRIKPGIPKNNLKDTIAQGLSEFFKFFMSNPNLTRIGFFLSPRAEEIKSQLASQIKENLIEETKDGYFQHEIDMGIVADGLVGMMERLTLTKLFPGLIEPEELAEEIVRIVLYGIETR